MPQGESAGQTHKEKEMDFVSLNFYIFLAVILLLYYMFPLRKRWGILLVGSIAFYAFVSLEGLAVLFAVVLVSYLFAVAVGALRKKGKILAGLVLFFGIVLVLLPLLAVKNSAFVIENLLKGDTTYWIVPLGLSFFTLQVVAYLVDVYRGKIKAQKNLLKYTLFVSFFPQIIQGPIPRYEQLGNQLFDGQLFEPRKVTKGLQLMLWGFFLKFMIADKAAIVVNTVFGNQEIYAGTYFWVAGCLYVVQLYTDFLACVCLAQGIAGLFGIRLTDNFRQPFLSRSIKELWGRWHITLGAWLRDYIYIPLGVNRHGKIRKYLNLIVVFVISGIWHGTADMTYIVWGLMQAIYQLVGDLTAKPKAKLYELMGFEKDGVCQKLIQRVGVFFWFLISVMIFRASSMEEGISVLRSMFTVFNPWILFDDSLFTLGLEWKEWVVLISSILLLIKVSLTQEKICIRNWVLRQPLIVRWVLYIGIILVVVVFGTYGYGFNAQDFIYGGF